MKFFVQARRAVKTVNLKFEEFAYDFNKQLGKWDRQYRVTEKAQQVKEYATEQAQNVDRQFGIRQKARNATTDFRLKFPTVCLFITPYSWHCFKFFYSSAHYLSFEIQWAIQYPKYEIIISVSAPLNEA